MCEIKKTIPPSRQAVPPPFTQGRLKDSCHICGSGATSASGGSFDEPIGSACEMPQGGLCKPPARLVVMTLITLSGYAASNLMALCPSLAVGTADHCRHLIRHLTVTPSPTGEGNRKALFRQQIYNASVVERSDLMKGSLREVAKRRYGSE